MAGLKHKITPFLWYDHQAEEAAKFYVSLFPNSKVVSVSRYTDVGPGPQGSVMTVKFQLDGQEFVALNGGPTFKLTEAFSLAVNCETQAEIDHFWEKLSEGGQKAECGWVKDRYGLSWQVTPTVLEELVTDGDREKADRVMRAMLKMKKLDIADLKAAFAGETVGSRHGH